MNKFKNIPILNQQLPPLVPISIQEQFEVVTLGQDSKLTDLIYRDQMRKFEVD